MNLGRALCSKGIIDVDHLPEEISAQIAPDEMSVAEGGKLADAEREVVQVVLENHNNNVSAAARELGITRATLYRKIKQFRL